MLERALLKTSGVPVSSIKTTFLFKCNNLVFSEPIVDACFTRDCQCILTCSTDECLRLFDKATGELLEE
jgi:hypothetical protein